MKKILWSVLFLGIMTLGVLGYEKPKRNFEIGDKSDISILQNDVTMTIKEKNLTNKGATLVLTNNSDKNFQYGNPYKIEIKKDGEWHKINVEVYFDMPAFQLPAKESKKIVLDWENGYGKLAKKTYRIIKGTNYKYEDGKYETFNVAAEFTID